MNTRDFVIGVIAALFVLNAGLVLRIGVYDKATIRERQVRGETKTPMFAIASFRLNWDVYDRENYAPPGQRLLPWLIVAQSAWALAVLFAVFYR